MRLYSIAGMFEADVVAGIAKSNIQVAGGWGYSKGKSP